MLDASETRCGELRGILRRHKLVFMQIGAVYEPLRSGILQAIATHTISAAALAKASPAALPDIGIVIVDGVEQFVEVGGPGSPSLGELRMNVDRCLELGANVCLISRAPRCAFPVVPGSSLLDDSKPYFPGLLDDNEVANAKGGDPSRTAGDIFPAVTFASMNVKDVFRAALKELGSNVLAAVDGAVFETGSRDEFVNHLDVREAEAVRGSGLAVQTSVNGLRFAVPNRVSEFREAVSDVLAEIVDAPPELSDISDGLWKIERSIRRTLRAHAIAQHGANWRRQVLHGDLASKALERARLDTSVSARSVSEVRDPLEWLSLGELLEVVQSSAGGLGADNIFWRKFSEEILPIRNRLSHMRLTRKGDRESVQAWLSHVVRTIK